MLWLLGSGASQALFAEGFSCVATEFRITGLSRTEETWFRHYLGLDGKNIGSETDLAQLREKIMTTDIFSSADTELKSSGDKSCLVTIAVAEKWTRIPVVRGVYGGGTPLLILGGYETNAFGRLMAIGGEVRRYGNMAPGAFFFFKSPRAWQGLGLWGTEIWLDRRRRAFYDVKGDVYGHADSESWTAKAQWLYPLGSSSMTGSYQAGFHLQVSRENPTTFKSESGYRGSKSGTPDHLTINAKSGFGGVFGPVVAFDNLKVNGLNMSGVKARLLAGGTKYTDGSGSFAEGEIYGFALLSNDINLATRLFAGSTTQKTLGSVYYLGGFDSIRGLPDGIHYGDKTIYANLEARMIAAKFKYAHVQSALFVDTGSAWMNSDSPHRGRETSLGAGIRIAVPQVYRLVLRIDYGVSVGHTKSRGFSVGLNQFFQPYKLVF